MYHSSEGRMHGKGLFTWSNGHTYKGGFKNDMKEGKRPPYQHYSTTP